MFISPKISNINVNIIFTNPLNKDDIIKFKEIINNKITNIDYNKPYGWFETRIIDIQFNENISNNIVLTNLHHYSHEIGISGTFTEKEMIIDNEYIKNKYLHFTNVNNITIGNDNEYSKHVELEYDTTYKDYITKDILFSYKLDYKIIDPPHL